MFQWILRRLEGYTPAYDRDQLITVVATILFVLADIFLHVFFAFVNFYIPELRNMNILSVIILMIAIYLILIKYKFIMSCYMIVILQCYYGVYTTYIIGYDKNGIILFPVIIFAIYTILKIRKKHINILTNIVITSSIICLYLKYFHIAKFEGELLHLETINVIFAISTCIFIIQFKKFAERFVDKYGTSENCIISNEAYQDFLTGLWNRRFMEREFARRNKLDNGVVILADVDYFKKINDTYGHNTGDYVLRKLSEIYRHNLRDCDVICRWGGEEFLFYIKDSNEEEAVYIFEAIRRKIEKTHFKFDGYTFNVTVSFGISEVDSNIDIVEVIGRADKAMYYCKHNGRNRVASYKVCKDNICCGKK